MATIKDKNSKIRHASLYDESKLTEKSPFEYREAYKALRTNVMFAMASSANKSRSVIISSAMPDECKSTVSANLAITLAQLGVKVLLVDADLRSPSQHHVFKVSNIRGLSQLIVGLEKFEDVINREVSSNLDLITAGGLAPNPSELLGSENMAELVKSFEDNYEYVVIDTPPVNVVTDALMFIDITAGIILMVREEKTTHREISRAISRIEMTRSPILGVVLTDTKEDMGLFKSYKSYKGKYKYGMYPYNKNK